LNDSKIRNEILESSNIDEDVIEKATDKTKKIQSLTTEVISLRLRIGKNSKLCGKRLFEDNTDTSLIGTQLSSRFVTDEDSLILFLNDIHKFVYQSANWKELYHHEEIKPVLNMIECFRNSHMHIIDMKGNGKGSDNGFKKIAKYNIDLVGNKILKKEQYPDFQIAFLNCIKRMFVYIEDNLETLLEES
jgi:hypothetical protein